MIYLLRHGQTEMNARGRYQGRIESPLTERGRAQALAMARALAGRAEGAVVLTSPLIRARRTADIVAAHLGLGDPEPMPGLIEVSMGEWEGMTADEIDAQNPGVRKSFARNEWSFHAPGGETHAQVSARLSRALDTIYARPGRVKIVVSHAVSGRVLRGLHAGIDPMAALRLEIPQEALFALTMGGGIERIACPA